jgi:DNA-binding CsgD family transcriptional regulator
MVTPHHRRVQAMASLDTAAVAKLINLLAEALDPSVERPLADRKRDLFQGVAAQIKADAWLCVVEQRMPSDCETGIALTLMDGGWKNERERAQVLGIVSRPGQHPPCANAFHDSLHQQAFATYRRDQVMDEAKWWSLSVGKTWRASGFDEFLVSLLPCDSHEFLWISFHRRLGKPRFTDRDGLIVHSVFSQIEWLRSTNCRTVTPDNLITLSPRERQVLLLLLGGDSQKQVASKLGLSPFTVGDHLKEIYRKLGVVSRAELLSKFISSRTLLATSEGSTH